MERFRRLPIGAEIHPEGGVHFRVWAPVRRRVDVEIQTARGARIVPLQAEPGGYFSAQVAEVGHGTRYRFRLDENESYPDPASRFQPEGPHGPSQVVAPGLYSWRDTAWTGVAAHPVVYELHIGTFTRAGTWEAAARQLRALADLGVNVVEIMPVAEFPGRFGWGYDGVNLFAPYHGYGDPDAMRVFVDEAHANGLAVVLDIVYNHLGPDGNYLWQFTDGYFTSSRPTEWGESIHFDGEGAGPVREYFTANATYWVDEFHIDGLRFDATQAIFDRSREHILTAIAQKARASAGERRLLLVAENEPQQSRLVRPPPEGNGLDAVWNDDFHHAARVFVTGRREAYYADYQGTPQELVSALRHGYLFQGQRYVWQHKPRGSSTRGLRAENFVVYLQNHDQVANSATGARLHALTSPGRLRATTALLLLSPSIPLLFQGQEFGASAPFLYFADHNLQLGEQVRRGRREFLEQFPSIATPEAQASLDDPGAAATFERCRLDHDEKDRPGHRELLALHHDLLVLRRDLKIAGAVVDGAVLARDAFCIRFSGGDAPDRLLLINGGRDLCLRTLAEPLLAPPDGTRWTVRWSSESLRYGASGAPTLIEDDGWRLPAESASLLVPAGEAHG